MHYTFGELIIAGWPVLSVLLVMSIVSCTVILERSIALNKASTSAADFIASVIKILRRDGLAGALEYCERSAKPVAAVARAVLAQRGGREAQERAAEHALQGQINDLEQYVPILGTMGSTAPFVGLFGTVLGIIRAFRDIAVNFGGGPEIVAGGIAEALITTAVGLVVAIPAVMGFNYCIRRVQRLSSEIDLAVYDLIEELAEGPSTRE